MKLKLFQKYLRAKGIDCAVFLNTSVRQQDLAIDYFTQIGYLEYCALVVTARSSYLLCSGFEYDRFVGKCSVPVRKGGRNLFDSLQKELGKGSTVGLNYRALDKHTFSLLKKQSSCKFVDVSSALLSLRQTKTSTELTLMKKAAFIGDGIISDCISSFKKFTSEQDVSKYLLKSCVDQGVTFSFPAIVASGKHAAICHHEPTSKLYKGFCVIDFGVKYKGYCSDMTRTLYIGKPSAKEREVYELLLKVQQQGVSMLKPGVTFNSVNLALRKSLGKYDKYFIHSFGHSLGMDVHDPLPVASKKLSFVKDMVFTMEPGIYVAGKFGMRIEDDVVVRSKPVVLTKASKRLICVNAQT